MKHVVFLTLIYFISCASKPNYKQEYQDYLNLVQESQERMSKPDFKVWLEGQLKAKEQEFAAYGGLNAREGIILKNHEQRLSGSYGVNDVYEHKKQTSEMQIRRYQEKRKYLEREIFLLKGLIAKFHSPFVP